jgi:hypothetical protein
VAPMTHLRGVRGRAGNRVLDGDRLNAARAEAWRISSGSRAVLVAVCAGWTTARRKRSSRARPGTDGHSLPRRFRGRGPDAFRS